jgi:WD40 repeat protein
LKKREKQGHSCFSHLLDIILSLKLENQALKAQNDSLSERVQSIEKHLDPINWNHLVLKQPDIFSILVLNNGWLALGDSKGSIHLHNKLCNFLTFKAHESKITCLFQMEDGRLVSGCSLNLIKVWTLKGEQLGVFTEHSHLIQRFLQIGDKLLSLSLDYTIRMWNMQTYAQEGVFTDYHSPHLLSVAVLKDGRVTSTSSKDSKVICVWNMRFIENAEYFRGHTSTVHTIIQLKNGNIASSSADKTIKIWDIFSGECLHTLSGHTKEVYALTELRNGTIASGSGDLTIKLWKPTTYECEDTLKWHGYYAHSIYEAGDNMLVSASSYEVKVWNRTTLKTVNSLNVKFNTKPDFGLYLLPVAVTCDEHLWVFAATEKGVNIVKQDL